MREEAPGIRAGFCAPPEAGAGRLPRPCPWEAGPGELRGAARRSAPGKCEPHRDPRAAGPCKEETAASGSGVSLQGKALLYFQGSLATADGMLLL